MIRLRSIWAIHLLLCACTLGGFATAASAVEPESGIYYNATFQGRGYFVEVQDGIVAVIVYTHDEQSGRPDWFLASGRLRDDADEVPGTDIRPLEGYYPLHWMTGPLYRYSGGPCIVCGPRRDSQGDTIPLTSEKVGTLSMYFDSLRFPHVFIQPDPGQVSADVLFELLELERTNFGHEVLGRRGEGASLLADQKGRWIFSFSGRSRVPVDVVWDSVQVVDLGVPAGLPELRAYRADYRDSRSTWTMTCYIGYRYLPAGTRPAAVPRSGCEIAQDGVVSFAALQQDIGLNEIAAFQGSLPEDSSETLRGALTIRGRRIE